MGIKLGKAPSEQWVVKRQVGYKGTEGGTWEALRWLDTVVYNHWAVCEERL